MYPQKSLTFLSLIIIILVIIPLGVSTLSGCGTSASASKKNKSKKSHAKHERVDDEDEESHAENESNTVDDKADKSKAEEKSHKGKEKSHAAKPKAPSAETIWADLMKGNERFRAGKHSNGQFIAARQELVKGQHPQVIVLGCADSRVPPEMVFDKNLGDLFVVRAAGNIADPVELGSIEYAIEHLHSTVLVVLGHENCGAVAAALSGEEMPSKNLEAIVEKIAPAFEGSKSCPMQSKMNLSCIELNVRQSAKDILSNSSIIEKAIEENHLTVIRAVYRLESGEVVRLS